MSSSEQCSPDSSVNIEELFYKVNLYETSPVHKLWNYPISVIACIRAEIYSIGQEPWFLFVCPE